MKARYFGLFGALAFAITLAAGPAGACPTGARDDIRPTRPVVTGVSQQARELLARATRLESVAASREKTARTRDRQADVLMSRARALQSQASLVAFSDREDFINVADELTIRAAEMRGQAVQDRADASSFRSQARVLRQRAVVLLRGGNENGGGGWRTRRAVRDFAPPPANTQGTTVL